MSFEAFLECVYLGRAAKVRRRLINRIFRILLYRPCAAFVPPTAITPRAIEEPL